MVLARQAPSTSEERWREVPGGVRRDATTTGGTDGWGVRVHVCRTIEIEGDHLGILGGSIYSTNKTGGLVEIQPEEEWNTCTVRLDCVFSQRPWGLSGSFRDSTFRHLAYSPTWPYRLSIIIIWVFSHRPGDRGNCLFRLAFTEILAE
jgi:hypothetical protein